MRIKLKELKPNDCFLFIPPTNQGPQKILVKYTNYRIKVIDLNKQTVQYLTGDTVVIPIIISKKANPETTAQQIKKYTAKYLLSDNHPLTRPRSPWLYILIIIAIALFLYFMIFEIELLK
jgi:hypothetical protein